MKILVLAGGYDQIALIQELKIRGHEVILADYFEKPPAKKYADRHYQVSTLDEEKILELAKLENIELITTVCTDQALMTVATVSEKLGLPCYITEEKGKAVTNKGIMKKILKENNIPTADYYFITENEWKSFQLSALKFPVVVKPCDCNSSKGVTKVKNTDELIDAVEIAFILSRSKTIIIESFVEGMEVSIDVWCDKEGSKVLSVSSMSKMMENKENFTIYQSNYPISMSKKLKENIEQVALKISKAFELNNCPLLIQGIIKGDEISVIEFSARMGGGTKYKLIEYMSGVNIMKAYVNRILGDTQQIITPKWSQKYIELNYLYAYNGVFSSLVNFDELRETKEIEEYFLYKLPGSKIEKRTTSSDRIVGILLIADKKEELLRKRNTILKKIDILDENGKSIIYKECFYNID